MVAVLILVVMFGPVVIDDLGQRDPYEDFERDFGYAVARHLENAEHGLLQALLWA